MIEQVLQQLLDKNGLSEQESYEAMKDIMEGRAQPAHIAAFLVALRMKGETAEEIAGGVRCLMEQCVRIRPAGFCVDPVGTGGDGTGTANISTMAALVASSAGATVAKHGNRSVSSRSGSADLLEQLGIPLDSPPDRIEAGISELGFGFLFAPAFHPAMRHAAPVRRSLAVRTLFNVLGPLANPAAAPGRLLGVYQRGLLPVAAETLVRLGVSRALVVHGSDGSDEITLSGPTDVIEVRDGEMTRHEISPEQFGLTVCDRQALRGGSPEDNARIARDVFAGTPGPMLDVTLLNAGATLYAGRAADSIADGVRQARDAVLSGRTQRHLDRIVRYYRAGEAVG